jgi:DNA-directed RNA polymerase subunit omega
MIEPLKSDEIVKKVGGRFRLAALIQRRLKELIEGSRPLVESEGKTLVEIAIQEIGEEKIAIDYDHTESLKPPDQAVLEKQIHTDAV